MSKYYFENKEQISSSIIREWGLGNRKLKRNREKVREVSEGSIFNCMVTVVFTHSYCCRAFNERLLDYRGKLLY